MKTNLLIAISALLLFSCGNELKPVEKKANNSSSFFDQSIDNDGVSNERTNVKLIEILQGERYSYLKVSDGKNEYWISTIKEEYDLTEEYFYTESIHKTDFFSTEFNRNFDDFYLVSDLQPLHNHTNDAHNSESQEEIIIKPGETNRPGSIKISDLIKNSKKYVGQEIQVTGKVVKVNANIMDRHWIHLKDGSYDDYDFVLTTKTVVPIGHLVTFKGTFNKDVDFGSGYRFEYIMEKATIVQ
jgi:hypothetical protein|tara:strand:- start:20057 stop:20782 length:726 start_codon:yes stop_codon:yes gene_type:complete